MSDFNPNARGHRASICVRACAGIPDELLEDPEYLIKPELDNLDTQINGRLELLQQRDELLTALKSVKECKYQPDKIICIVDHVVFKIEHFDNIVKSPGKP